MPGVGPPGILRQRRRAAQRADGLGAHVRGLRQPSRAVGVQRAEVRGPGERGDRRHGVPRSWMRRAVRSSRRATSSSGWSVPSPKCRARRSGLSAGTPARARCAARRALLVTSPTTAYLISGWRNTSRRGESSTRTSPSTSAGSRSPRPASRSVVDTAADRTPRSPVSSRGGEQQQGADRGGQGADPGWRTATADVRPAAARPEGPPGRGAVPHAGPRGAPAAPGQPPREETVRSGAGPAPKPRAKPRASRLGAASRSRTRCRPRAGPAHRPGRRPPPPRPAPRTCRRRALAKRSIIPSTGCGLAVYAIDAALRGVRERPRTRPGFPGAGCSAALPDGRNGLTVPGRGPVAPGGVTGLAGRWSAAG